MQKLDELEVVVTDKDAPRTRFLSTDNFEITVKIGHFVEMNDKIYEVIAIQKEPFVYLVICRGIVNKNEIFIQCVMKKG